MNIFNYFLKDTSWKKKFLIGASLDFIIMLTCFTILTVLENESLIIQPIYRNVLLIAFFIFVLTLIFYLGYLSINTNLRISKPDYILANFENPKKIFLIGIKTFFVIGIMPQVYALLLIPLYCVSLFIQKILYVSYVSTFINFLSLFVIAVLGIIIIYSSFLSFFYDLRIRSAFNLERIRKIISKGAYNVLFAIIKNLFLVSFLGMILLFSGAWIKKIYIVAFLGFWLSVVVSENNAKCLRKTLETDFINN